MTCHSVTLLLPPHSNTPNAINNTATSSITAGLVPLMPAVPVAVPPPHPSAIVHPAALVNRLFQMQTSLPPPPPQGVPLPSMQGMPPSMQGMPPHGGPGYPGFQASGFNWNNTQRVSSSSSLSPTLSLSLPLSLSQ